jgi:hypothetical protein
VFPVGIGLRDPRSQKRDLGHPSVSPFNIAEGTSIVISLPTRDDKKERATFDKDWLLNRGALKPDLDRSDFLRLILLSVLTHVLRMRIFTGPSRAQFAPFTWMSSVFKFHPRTPTEGLADCPVKLITTVRVSPGSRER